MCFPLDKEIIRLEGRRKESHNTGFEIGDCRGKTFCRMYMQRYKTRRSH